jgi:hypothetical protein
MLQPYMASIRKIILRLQWNLQWFYIDLYFNFKIMHPIVLDYKIRNKQKPSNTTCVVFYGYLFIPYSVF